MQPNAIHLLMRRNGPIVMLQKKHHIESSLLQIVVSPQMTDIFSVLLDLVFLAHRPSLTLLQAALVFSLVSNLA
jgi:hypothetical protein